MSGKLIKGTPLRVKVRVKPKEPVELTPEPEEPEDDSPKLCPRCGSNVLWDYSCHTYEAHGQWRACLPCDSAIQYSCKNEDCRWSFTHGLNPKSPHTATNEENRPEWLVGPLEWTSNIGGLGISSPIIASGVVSFWDDDEDE